MELSAGGAAPPLLPTREGNIPGSPTAGCLLNPTWLPRRGGSGYFIARADWPRSQVKGDCSEPGRPRAAAGPSPDPSCTPEPGLDPPLAEGSARERVWSENSTQRTATPGAGGAVPRPGRPGGKVFAGSGALSTGCRAREPDARRWPPSPAPSQPQQRSRSPQDRTLEAAEDPGHHPQYTPPLTAVQAQVLSPVQEPEPSWEGPPGHTCQTPPHRRLQPLGPQGHFGI